MVDYHGSDLPIWCMNFILGHEFVTFDLVALFKKVNFGLVCLVRQVWFCSLGKFDLVCLVQFHTFGLASLVW